MTQAEINMRQDRANEIYRKRSLGALAISEKRAHADLMTAPYWAREAQKIVYYADPITRDQYFSTIRRQLQKGDNIAQG